MSGKRTAMPPFHSPPSLATFSSRLHSQEKIAKVDQVYVSRRLASGFIRFLPVSLASVYSSTPTILPGTSANSSSAKIVPEEPCAIASTEFPVILADWNRPLRRTSGVDHADTVNRCAVVLPNEVRPERSMPQVGRRVRLTSVPANPASVPKVQCSHPTTEAATVIAAR